MTKEGTIQSEYNKYVSEDRKPYEDRAEVCAKLTLPFLFTESSFNRNEALEDNYVQSLGARAVNHLAAKIVMSLLPPAGQFFRYEPDSVALNELTQGDQDRRQQIASIMSQQSIRVHEEVKAQDIRTPIFNAIRMLLVTGSVLIEKIEGSGVRMFGLRSFVVKRDPRGGMRELIFEESISKDNLPSEIVPESDKEYYNLFTKVKRSSDQWIQTQEIDGQRVDKEVIYNDDEMPFQVLDWTLIDGENYGRSYVSQNIGDLSQYETLSEVLTQGSVIASKTIIFVNPLSAKGTKKRDLVRAKNGAVLNGSAEDVSAFQLQKNYDFQVAEARLQKLERQIGSAFLMQSAVQRDAERVTAEEIKFMAQELETAFAGIYSTLAKNLLKRIVTWIALEIGVQLGDEINTTIIVGVDALSRSAESQKLDAYLSRMANLGLMDYINRAEVATRYAVYDGIDSVGLLKTQTQVNQENAQKQQAMLQQQAQMAGADSLGTDAGKAIVEQAKG